MKTINVDDNFMEDLLKSDKIKWKKPITLTKEEFDKLFPKKGDEITDLDQLI
jgi:hypothetical protein